MSKKKKQKRSETANLEGELVIGLNARVMLTRNTDVDNGLCNGALGTVRKIILNNQNVVVRIMVEFDHARGSFASIERMEAEYMIRKNVYSTRNQFPLTLAWAITIHKCQGLTLKNILVDLGSSIFEFKVYFTSL